LTEESHPAGSHTDLFSGIRVVELASWVFVPVAGALLADWGAEVIKVEHPVTGDGYRGLVTQGMGGGDGVNPSMELANRGKRSIGLDLKSSQGREILLRLISQSDVFLTNYLPSVLDRLGLTVDVLRQANPGLIYARGHGFGVRGPEADRPAYDSTAFWARGGLGETLTPSDLEQPIPQRGAVGDRNGAVHLAFGISGALFRRQRTGEGATVDVSLLATAMWMLGSDVLAALQGKFVPTGPTTQAERQFPPNPLTANYRCADGRYLALCCLQPDPHWPSVCAAVGRPELVEDSRFTTIGLRNENRQACVEELESAFATRTLAEWSEAFREEKFPWGPFQKVTELVDDPQVLANGYIGEMSVDGTSIAMPTGALQIDEAPAHLRQGPAHGQDTELVLQELDYDWDDIIRFKGEGVVL
jgi:crotonobetainyl-CoA:carnitine CoA-transferase CaiB-like acyl-CoA transferase